MGRAAGFNTLAVHAGTNPDPLGSVVPPIYQTSTFAFGTVAEGARRAQEASPAFYTRWANPTVRVAEERIAALEGGEACLLTASGMAAISHAVLAVVRSGDHIVSADAVYSATFELFHTMLPAYGIETTFVDPQDPDRFARAIRPNTRLVYIETPANPVMKVTDIAAVAAIAREAGAFAIADNTFASPYNTRPLALGADAVVHSATKYLGGHHHLVAGAVVGTRRFVQACWDRLRIYGGSADPFAAWLLLTGVQTLGLRMERQNQSAISIARFLAGHPRVERVFYPGLADHPNHEVAARQMRGFGGMLAFEVRGGVQAGARLVERLRVMKLAVSLGGVHSLVTHAASTTHLHVPREERIRAGITDGLIRVSVGIEDVEDLLEDLEQALGAG
ncbi:MAG: PLP-dependent aspartate aminotransferase family protein [Armatimonadota bacterium]|nr:PLP-dependent aspartate aminotransferase family protein [Armatimonadota bacterium]MDR5696306.1 PLP-dependent aspartate aminotransferase family protein [Armatimonadota bacterium]